MSGPRNESKRVGPESRRAGDNSFITVAAPAAAGTPFFIASAGIPTAAADDQLELVAEANYLPVKGLNYVQAMEKTNGPTIVFAGTPYQALSLDTEF